MSMRIRMYDVGFGDCFLLSFPEKVHVLVDCGIFVTQQRDRVSAAVENILDVTKGAIAVVVVTHLHQDHHIGFTSKKTLWDDRKQVRVGEVWLPWTENPHDPLAVEVQQKIGLSIFGISKQDADWLRVAGFGGVKRRYLPDGKPLSIQGVNARVECYGPPKDPAFFRREEATERLLRAAGTGTGTGKGVPLFAPVHCRPRGKEEAPLQDMVASDEDILSAANKLMNNRSLILLIRYGGHGILLPGDAEQGSWIGAFDTTDLAAQLEDVTVLKVGHHGSSNATPRRLVKALKKPVTSLLSTEPGVSGSVPEDSVVKALRGLGRVIRSDEVEPKDDGGGWRDWRGG